MFVIHNNWLLVLLQKNVVAVVSGQCFNKKRNIGFIQANWWMSFISILSPNNLTQWSKHKSSRLQWVGGLAKAARNPALTSGCWTRTKPRRQSHWVSPAAGPVWSRKSGMAAKTFPQMFRVLLTHQAIYPFSSVPSLFCFYIQCDFMYFIFWRIVQVLTGDKDINCTLFKPHPGIAKVHIFHTWVDVIL